MRLLCAKGLNCGCVELVRSCGPWRDSSGRKELYSAPRWATRSRARLRTFLHGCGRTFHLSLALLPYIAADHLFLDLVLSLIERCWSAKVVNEAVSVAGFDLTSLVNRFLAMKQLVPKLSANDVDHFKQIQGILAAIA